jgi:hypothetical protein
VRLFFAVILFCLLSDVALARSNGGAPPPSCTAMPPSQASAIGLTALVLCDTFATNHGIDVNGTFAPGFEFYPQNPYTSGFPKTPAAYMTNDGTGFSLLGCGGSASGPTNSGKCLQSAGPNASPPYYVGTVYSGSFYAEIDMKIQSSTPSGQFTANSPAFWMNNVNRYTAEQQSIAAPSSTEIDIIEWIPNATVGQPATFNSGLVHWHNTATIDCATSPGVNAPSNSAVYNTYGVLVQTSIDGGGTGTVQTYVNNNLSLNCTYNSGGLINCNSAGNLGCDAGAMSEMDSAQQTMFFLSTGYYPWPDEFRNFHVWQK